MYRDILISLEYSNRIYILTYNEHGTSPLNVSMKKYIYIYGYIIIITCIQSLVRILRKVINYITIALSKKVINCITINYSEKTN